MDRFPFCTPPLDAHVNVPLMGHTVTWMCPSWGETVMKLSLQASVHDNKNRDKLQNVAVTDDIYVSFDLTGVVPYVTCTNEHTGPVATQ
jgi:hypothetical protein